MLIVKRKEHYIRYTTCIIADDNKGYFKVYFSPCRLIYNQCVYESLMVEKEIFLSLVTEVIIIITIISQLQPETKYIQSSEKKENRKKKKINA